jgi:hypothetical protein
VVWSTWRSHGPTSLTLFTSSVSLFRLFDRFITRLFFGSFDDIFEGLSRVPSSFRPRQLSHFEPILTLIGQATSQIVALLRASVSSLEILLSLGRVRSKTLYHDLVPKRSTMPWHTLPERLYGSVGDFLIAGFIWRPQRHYFLSLRAPFRLRQIRCFMQEFFRPNISKLIATTFVENFLMAPSHYFFFLFPAACRFIHKDTYYRSAFLVDKLSILSLHASWVWGSVLSTMSVTDEVIDFMLYAVL